MSDPSTTPSAATSAEPAAPTGSPLPVFLSTEHWSLLGTRSMTWAEVMSRITIHLTVVVSAFLAVLAVTVQVTGFGTPFRVMAIGLATAALVMGSLTSVRVRAMNRVRHATSTSSRSSRPTSPRRCTTTAPG